MNGPKDSISRSDIRKSKLLRFRDDVYGDPVSVKLAVASFKKGEEDFDIEWPSVMSECLGNLREFILHAEDYKDYRSLFYGTNPDSVAYFIGEATSAINLADRIRLGSPKRVVKLISGMAKYWGVGNFEEDALLNYLTLANFMSMRPVLYYLRHRVLYDEYFPKQVEYWYEALNGNELNFIPKIFSFEGPVYNARVYELCGEPLIGQGGEYFWGPLWMIMDAIKCEKEDRPITNPWFVKYLIPQNNLRLAEAGSDQQFNYNERAKINKVIEHNGREMY